MSRCPTPFGYQQDALLAIDAAQAKGERTAFVVMASGLGKTYTAAFHLEKLFAQLRSARRLGRQLRDNPGSRALVLCHQNEILRQSERRFKAVLGEDLSTGFYLEGHRDLSAQVTFASFQSMYGNLHQLDRRHFRYGILDEVHHVPAPTFKAVATHFDFDFTLGMTATRERADGQLVEAILGDPVYSLELPSALARGLLAEVDYRLITDELIRKGAVDLGDQKVTIEQLNRSLFIPVRDETIVDIVRAHIGEIDDPRVIFFAQNIEHSNNLARLFGGVTYHSGLPPQEQRDAMDAFREGRTQAIHTVNKFNEGIHVPRANVIVFARVTQSPTIFYQQLGRGLGGDHVLALDFALNIERIQQLAQLRDSVHRAKQKELGSARYIKSPGIKFKFDERSLEILGYLNRRHSLRTKEGVIAAGVAIMAERGLDKGMLTRQEINAASREGLLPSTRTIDRMFGVPDSTKSGFRHFREGLATVTGVPLKPDIHDPIEVISAGVELMEERGLEKGILTVRDINAASREGRFPSADTVDRIFQSKSVVRGSKRGAERTGLRHFQEALSERTGVPLGAVRTPVGNRAEVVKAGVELMKERGLEEGVLTRPEIQAACRDRRLPSVGYIHTMFKVKGSPTSGLRHFHEALAASTGVPLPPPRPSFNDSNEVLEAGVELIQGRGSDKGPLTKRELAAASKQGRLPSVQKIERMFKVEGSHKSGIRHFQEAMAAKTGAPLADISRSSGNCLA